MAGKGFWTYENRVVFILTLGGGIAGLDTLAINYLAPFVATELHLSNTQIGMIGAAGLVGWSISALIAAPVSDRMGRRKPFLIGGFICFALFSVASAAAWSFLSMFLARFLVTLAEGPIIPMQQSIALAESSPHRRGLNMGIVQNFGSQLIGALAGPLLLVWIAAHLGWRNAFLIAGLPALILAAVIAWYLREPGSEADTSPVASATLGEMVGGIVFNRNIVLCFVIGAVAIGWFATMLAFVPLWSIRVLGLSSAAMSVVISCLGGAGAVSAILVPWLSDRFGRRPMMFVFGLIGIVAPLGLLFCGNDLLTVCAVMFVGCLFMGIFPLFIGVVPMESVDARYAATALAIVMGLAQIVGGFIGPLLGGVLADQYSLAAPYGWRWDCLLSLR